MTSLDRDDFALKRLTGLTPKAWSTLALSDVGSAYVNAVCSELVTL